MGVAETRCSPRQSPHLLGCWHPVPASVGLGNTAFRAEVLKIDSHHFTAEELEAQKSQVTCPGDSFFFDGPQSAHTPCPRLSSSSFSPNQLLLNFLSERMAPPSCIQTALPKSWPSPMPLLQSQHSVRSPRLARCLLTLSASPSLICISNAIFFLRRDYFSLN